MKIQLWSVVLAALIIGLSLGSLGGYKHGKAVVYSKWNQEVAEQAKKAVGASETNRGKEQTHAVESNKVTDDAQVSREQYEADILAAQSGADDRVRQSEARADKYRAMSQASAAEQKRLAEYAAKLDATLTEGRQLAQELRGTLAERDRTIQNLRHQIEADRTLTGEANAIN